MTFKDKLRELKEVSIIPDGNKNRHQRLAISDLRSEGIIFIPIGKFKYKRIEYCDQEQINSYVRKHIASLQTQYFNSLAPIKKYMNQEHLNMIHNGGLFND